MSASKHPAQGPSKPTRHQQKPVEGQDGIGSGHVHQQRVKNFEERDNPNVAARKEAGSK
jgi:hypothetical protein